MLKDLQPYLQHLAIIMDGNGRWALARNLPRVAGHRAGMKSLEDILTAIINYNIKHLTLFAFSSENWRRPEYEVKTLIKLMMGLITDKLEILKKENIVLNFIGELSRLPEELFKCIQQGIAETKNNTGLNLHIAINYGGRWDIVQACKKLTAQAINGEIDYTQINEDSFNRACCLGEIPPPDLLIRTSGEERLSNFLLWQLAYTEFYFSSCCWPDFNVQELEHAIKVFLSRKRRFGGLNAEDPIQQWQCIQ